MRTTMPFGKYEGLTIKELIQIDYNYCQFLLEQHWFREKFRDLARQLNGEEPEQFSIDQTPRHREQSLVIKESSPMHNEMQVRFLDEKICQTLCRRLYREGINPGKPRFEDNNIDVILPMSYYREQLKRNEHVKERSPDWKERRITIERRITPVEGRRVLPEADYFVVKKEDRRQLKKVPSKELRLLKYWKDRRQKDKHTEYGGQGGRRGIDSDWTSWSDNWNDRRTILRQEEKFDLYIELKPTLGDDYPSVVRVFEQRLTKASEWRRELLYSQEKIIPLIMFDTFTAEKVTLEQVRQMFPQFKFICFSKLKIDPTP